MQLFRRIATVVAAGALALSLCSVVIAAEAVPTVEISGAVVGPDGAVVPVKGAKLYEWEFEGAELLVTDIVVAEDGTFSVALRVWGTPETPARARIVAEGSVVEEEVSEDGCVVHRWPTGAITLEIPGVVPPDPVVIVMDDFNSIGACTATPAPTPTAPEAPPAPGITLPPTDASAMPAVHGSAVAGLGLMLLAVGTTAVFLRPRRTRGR